jgi:hypothetical protein
MNNIFYDSLEEINESKNPIKVAWDLSIKHLDLSDILSNNFTQSLFKNIHCLDTKNSYHNHYHLAHVILGSAYLLKAENSSLEFRKQNGIPLLLASLFHDADHPGGGNKFPYQLEKKAVRFFIKYFEDNELINAWNNEVSVIKKVLPNWDELKDLLNDLILGTEFKEEPIKIYDSYKNKLGRELTILKTILIESDILLSSLSKTGLLQTDKILTENNLNLDKNTAWMGFLNNIKNTYYQSNAAKKFKILEQIENTLNYLNENNGKCKNNKI